MYNTKIKLRTTRTQVIKTQIKEESWGETHLAWGSQLVRDLTSPSVPA